MSEHEQLAEIVRLDTEMALLTKVAGSATQMMSALQTLVANAEAALYEVRRRRLELRPDKRPDALAPEQVQPKAAETTRFGGRSEKLYALMKAANKPVDYVEMLGLLHASNDTKATTEHVRASISNLSRRGRIAQHSKGVWIVPGR